MCGARVSYPDSRAGKSAKCPRCSSSFDLPLVDAFDSTIEDELAGRPATADEPRQVTEGLASEIRLAILEAHREAREARPRDTDESSFASSIFGVVAFVMYVLLLVSGMGAFVSVMEWTRSESAAAIVPVAFWSGAFVSSAMTLCLLEIESHLRSIRHR